MYELERLKKYIDEHGVVPTSLEVKKNFRINWTRKVIE